MIVCRSVKVFALLTSFVVFSDESLYDDDYACRGARKPYLPADCPFYMLRDDDNEECHIDWSRGEVDFLLDCRFATDNIQEDLSAWTVARVMALCSAPLVAAETEPDTETDKTDHSFSNIVDSIPGSLVLDDDTRLSVCDTFKICLGVNANEPTSSVTESICVAPELELDDSPHASPPSLLSTPPRKHRS